MNDSRSEAAESNLSAFLIEIGRMGGGDVRRDREIAWTVGGSPIGYHNAVVHCDTSSERVDALIEEWAIELRDRGLPGSWHVSPFMRPHDLAERLAARGFNDGGDEPAMAADLTSAQPDLPPLEGLTIERVRDDAGLDAFRWVLSRGFGEGLREADWVAGVYRRIGWSDEVPWRHYAGWLNNEPVSTATLFLTASVAGIYFVSTSPQHRRRGFGTAITRHAMREAQALGCTVAVLGSSPMGYSVYRRLGFDEIFRYRLFEWSPGGD